MKYETQKLTTQKLKTCSKNQLCPLVPPGIFFSNDSAPQTIRVPKCPNTTHPHIQTAPQTATLDTKPPDNMAQYTMAAHSTNPHTIARESTHPHTTAPHTTEVTCIRRMVHMGTAYFQPLGHR